MSLAVPVKSMIDAARRLVVQETLDEANAFATDDELLIVASGEAAELDDLIHEVHDDDFNRAITPLTLEKDVSVYPLGADFYKIISVDIEWSPSSIRTSAKRFTEAERNRFRTNIAVSWTPFGRVFYRTVGSNIEFIPTPLAAVKAYVNYLPVTTMFTDIDHDTYEANNNWHWAIIYGLGVYLANKDANEELAAMLAARKASVFDRVRTHAGSRNEGEPPRVQRRRSSFEEDD